MAASEPFNTTLLDWTQTHWNSSKKPRLSCVNVNPCASFKRAGSWSNTYASLSVGNHLHTESLQEWTTGPSKKEQAVTTSDSLQSVFNPHRRTKPLISRNLRPEHPCFSLASHYNWSKSNKTSMKHPLKTLTLPVIYWIPCITPWIFRTCRCLPSNQLPALCALSPVVTSMNLLPVAPYLTWWLMTFSNKNERSNVWKVNCLSCWPLAEQVASKSWGPVQQEPVSWLLSHRLFLKRAVTQQDK